MYDAVCYDLYLKPQLVLQSVVFKIENRNRTKYRVALRFAVPFSNRESLINFRNIGVFNKFTLNMSKIVISP